LVRESRRAGVLPPLGTLANGAGRACSLSSTATYPATVARAWIDAVSLADMLEAFVVMLVTPTSSRRDRHRTMRPMRTKCIALMALALALVGAGACGDSDDDAQAPKPTATAQAREATPTPKPLPARKQIEQAGEAWAPLFAAADEAACEYMIKSAQEACDIGVFVDGKPSKFQRSFADATIESVKIRGNKAGGSFSNGETVVFEKDDSGDDVPNSEWGIANLGGDAGKSFFE
jgi:hypothetical protein